MLGADKALESPILGKDELLSPPGTKCNCWMYDANLLRGALKMEKTVLVFDDVLAETLDLTVWGEVNHLDELHLAMVGGGCAEVCPY